MTETTALPGAAAGPGRWQGLGAAWARASGAAHASSAPLLLTAQGLWSLSGTPVWHASFAAWCAQHPGQACTLWAGADVLVDLVADDEPTLQAPAARSAWARRVLQHYHGEAAQDWALWPWGLQHAAGVSALREVPLAALQAEAAAQGVRLHAVLPLWPQLLHQALLEAGRAQALHTCWLVEAPLAASAMASTAPPVLTQVLLRAGRLQGLQRRRLPGPVGASLKRLMDEAAPGSTHTLLWWGAEPALDAPWPAALRPARVLPDARSLALPARPGAGDFLQPRPRASLLAWLWLATCAGVLAVSALEAQASWQARAEAQARPSLAAARGMGEAAPGGSRTAAREAAPPAAEAALGTLLNELQRRRAHPWAAAFLASELPAVAGLRWLSMEHGATGELRLQGLAAEPGSVQRAADALRLQPHWQTVLVARLEAQDAPAPGAAPGPTAARGTAPAAGGLSFEILARLRARSP
ncbi:hypothetical protein [Rubrivivax rivuli]|uniref:Uncharacterized protein n=1 Tax=Rubrivivax rivuli TaxID=1862385 RepID=A0A437REC6_9BURK|nr:hypothetical protein [Rubrivivax rivuli]RVU45120.1 hypothetical protein EOE66_13260 [Rubrivivax rivuli]